MAFATTADFATFYQNDLSAADAATVEQLLEMATSVIRDETRQHLSLVANDPVVLRGSGLYLFLPELPVVGVASVVEDGTTLTADDDYHLTDHGVLYREEGWDWSEPVTVTYSHGYADIPESIKMVCLSLTARSFMNPKGHSSQSSESFAVSFFPTGLTDNEKDLLRRYRV